MISPTVYTNDYNPTAVPTVATDTSYGYVFSSDGRSIFWRHCAASFPAKKPETKKERTARIAKERMLASWKTHNQKTISVIELKQVCKPKHNLFRK